MFLIGKEITSRDLGLLTAFLVAISLPQIRQSTDLVQPGMVGVIAVFAVFFFVRYIKYSKSLDAFLLGFLVANAINIHFQSIGLITLLPVSFFLSKHKLKQCLFLLIGFFIPFIPLILFDFKTNFFESRNMLDYYLYGQNRIYIPNRWLTYVGVFWPRVWSDIVGGYPIFGYFITILLSLVMTYKILKKKISKEILGIIICFGLTVIMLRYYKGILSAEYLAFLQPFIFILTGIVFYEIYKFKKILFICLIISITVTSLFIDIKEIVKSTNTTAVRAEKQIQVLVKKYPNDKFTLFDYKRRFAEVSLPLSMYLYSRGKVDDSGLRVGISAATSAAALEFSDFPAIEGKPGDFQLLDLSKLSKAELVKAGWVIVNPSFIYNSVENWYTNKK
jgi:hypothetical protein